MLQIQLHRKIIKSTDIILLINISTLLIIYNYVFLPLLSLSLAASAVALAAATLVAASLAAGYCIIR